MYLSHLSLNEFRNYRHLDLSLGQGLFLFYGENAQGKTNLLEGIGMLATGSSFHTTTDREVVNWYAPDHIAHMKADVKRREDDVELEMVVFDPTPPTLEGADASHSNIALPANMQRKRVKVNAVPKKVIDLIGQMKVVLFAPTDLNLVDGSPEERRRFLDRALCQVQPRYCQALLKYRKIVVQRSALLKRIRENLEEPQMLNYLDEQLTLLASQIINERHRMITMVNQYANEFQQAISGGYEQLQIIYRPSLKVEESLDLIELQKKYREQLRVLRQREIIQGV